jgi:hypothetical protein
MHVYIYTIETICTGEAERETYFAEEKFQVRYREVATGSKGAWDED